MNRPFDEFVYYPKSFTALSSPASEVTKSRDLDPTRLDSSRLPKLISLEAMSSLHHHFKTDKQTNKQKSHKRSFFSFSSDLWAAKQTNKQTSGFAEKWPYQFFALFKDLSIYCCCIFCLHTLRLFRCWLIVWQKIFFYSQESEQHTMIVSGSILPTFT